MFLKRNRNENDVFLLFIPKSNTSRIKLAKIAIDEVLDVDLFMS